MTVEEAKTLKKGDKVRYIGPREWGGQQAGGIFTFRELVGKNFLGVSDHPRNAIADSYIEDFELVKNTRENESNVELIGIECKCPFTNLGHDLDCEYVKAKQKAI